jgi:hypothetical protein
MITISIPGLRTTTESNAKGHWRPKAARAKQQRHRAALSVRAQIPLRLLGRAGLLPGVRLTITITRIGPRALDVDNAWSSQKHVIDGIADAFAIDDRDPRVEWRVQQRKGAPKEHGVEIRIEARSGEGKHS